MEPDVAMRRAVQCYYDDEWNYKCEGEACVLSFHGPMDVVSRHVPLRSQGAGVYVGSSAVMSFDGCCIYNNEATRHRPSPSEMSRSVVNVDPPQAAV